jgi:hypothetical protein
LRLRVFALTCSRSCRWTRLGEKNLELTEIIMEINDLQKTFIDNRPLAQTIWEINDLREFNPLFEHHYNWFPLIFRRFIFQVFFLFFSGQSSPISGAISTFPEVSFFVKASFSF